MTIQMKVIEQYFHDSVTTVYYAVQSDSNLKRLMINPSG